LIDYGLARFGGPFFSEVVMAEKWIQSAIKKPGALRKSLKVKEGETIPTGKLKKASHSENPTLAKRANLALTLKKLNKRHGGQVDGAVSAKRLDRKPRAGGGCY
jgi:hypothetical protein